MPSEALKARTDLAQAELPIDAQADDQPADQLEDYRAALLVYHGAVFIGTDVDQARNTAEPVTVE